MRFNKTAIKGIAATLVLGQLNMALQPLYAATREDKGASSPMVRSQIERMQALQRDIDAAKVRQAQESQGPADQASQRLARVEALVRDIAFLGEPLQAAANAKQQDQVRAIGPNLKARVKPLTAEQKAQRHDRRQQLIAELKGLLGQQAQDQAAVRAEFAQTRQTLLDRKLPAEILARHDAAVAKFEQRVSQFNQSASKAQQGDEQALAELQGFFDQNPTKRQAAPVDPAKLPWRTPEPTKRLPAETQTAWFQNLYANKGTRLAQVGNSLEGLEFVTPPEPGVAPTAADLAETPETQRTAAIKAKALELGNNPVNIQNWVRNNVEWVPTWGAIQSAQDTLDKKRGNAIDIASLEIALLRAAKIPARYQFGTIELPAEQVMNWVGGVTKPEAAQQLLGQGGIANRGLIEGGRISKIRMEHAWVQAYVNWLPSRGAKQGSATQHPSPQGQRNAWVPLDSSIKQYARSNGTSTDGVFPKTAEDLLAVASQGGSVTGNGTELKNLNVSGLQGEVTASQTRLRTLIDQTVPSGQLGDLVGRSIIKSRASSILEGAPNYPVLSMGSTVAAVPEALRHKFSYQLFSGPWFGDESAPLLDYVAPTSQLAGKRLTLRYVAATQADADAIAAYMLPDASSAQDPTTLAKRIPGYLIRLRPELLLDGAVVAAGSSPVQMGESLNATGGFTRTDFSGWDYTQDQSNVAGQVTAIGLSLGGVSHAQLDALVARMQAADAAIAQGRTASLKGEEVAGDLLSGAMWTWYAAAERHHHVIGAKAQVVENPGLSYGLFHTAAKVTTSWGVIRGFEYRGVNFDIGHVRSLSWAEDGDKGKWIHYNRLRGIYMSELEASVPEKYFAGQADCAQPAADCSQGVSATRLIRNAAKAQQKVFSLDQAAYAANPSVIDVGLSQHSAGVKAQVREALLSGKEVLIHEKPMNMNGWQGAGFIITDPDTGSGAYLIEGMSNGGFLVTLILTIICFIIATFVLLNGSLLLGAFLLGWEILNFKLWIDGIKGAQNDTDLNKANFGQAVGAMLGLLPTGGVALAEITKWYGLFMVLLLTNTL